MIRRVRGIILFVGLILTASFTCAQFELSTELRPRSEFRDGFKTLLGSEQKGVFTTSQRSRLNIAYSNSKLETFLAIQDIRVWGDEVYKTDNAVVNVYQAFGVYHFNDQLNFKVGRQELIYDNKRLLGNRDWNNVGASHDLALIRYSQNRLTIHLGAGINNEKENSFKSDYTLSYYKYLAFAWMNKVWDNGISLSLIHVSDGFQDSNNSLQTNSRNTTGFYSKWNNKSKITGSELAFYYQYGNNADNTPINAYYLSASQFFKPTKNLKLLAAVEYLSGDDNINDNKEFNTFDKLYGNGHSPYGYMDYFTEIPKHTKNGGLVDSYFRITYQGIDKTEIELTTHNFRLSGILPEANNNNLAADQNLGIEIDLMAKIKIQKDFEIRTGYSTMLADNSMQLLKGGDAEKLQHWGWVMLIFKPTLFRNK